MGVFQRRPIEDGYRNDQPMRSEWKTSENPVELDDVSEIGLEFPLRRKLPVQLFAVIG